MSHLYCISGLGADERAFSKLRLPQEKVTYLNWEIPEPEETLTAYTNRFVSQIQHERPVLLGLSFGGMMCVEIAKQMDVQKIVMISSIKTKEEKPWLFRISGKYGLHKYLPLKPYTFLEPIENYNLGVTTEEEKKLVREYRKKVSQIYTDWAIDQILTWQNQAILPNLIHIHGSADRIFPIKNIQADYVIEGGGHFMIMNRAEEINRILQAETIIGQKR